MSYVYKIIDSPVGKLKLVASHDRLAAILWENDNPNRVKLGALVEDCADPVLVEAERQLTDYFYGKRKSFSLKLGLVGTKFQNEVWQALLAIPFGETRSYGQLASQLGNPRASRAVGAAIGKNPISIIVPCHRAIGASGQLTGFAGGLMTKAKLLELEGSYAASAARRDQRASRRPRARSRAHFARRGNQSVPKAPSLAG